MPGSAGDGGVRHQIAEQIREGGVGTREQRAEDQQQNRGHGERAQTRAHVAPGTAGPFAQPAPAPGGAGDQGVEHADGTEQDGGQVRPPCSASEPSATAATDGEERRPVRVAQRGHAQQGEPADAPDQRPRRGRRPAAWAAKYAASAAGIATSSEVERQAVTQEQHAEHVRWPARPTAWPYAPGPGPPPGASASQGTATAAGPIVSASSSGSRVSRPPGNGLCDGLVADLAFPGRRLQDHRSAASPRSPAPRARHLPAARSPGSLGSDVDGMSDTGPPPCRS